MPVRRFFAMLNSSRGLQAQEMLEAIDVAAIPICSTKWYEHLRDRWVARLDVTAKNGPTQSAIENEAKLAGQRMTDADTAGILKERLGLFKQLRGYGI